MAENTNSPLYEGKAKILYPGSEAGTIRQYFKDDATAFNAQKREVIAGKEDFEQPYQLSFVSGYRSRMGIPHHFIEKLSTREQLVKAVEIVPVEVIIRNVAAGSICPRLGLIEETSAAYTG